MFFKAKELKLIAICSLLVFIVGCSKTPIANFSFEPQNPTKGEEVKFTNKSENAKSYSWNFGDMFVGKETNPVHIYQNAGTYIIDLHANNGLKSDVKTVTIIVGE